MSANVERRFALSSPTSTRLTIDSSCWLIRQSIVGRVGNCTSNRVPEAEDEISRNSPPWRRTISLAIQRPKPFPVSAMEIIVAAASIQVVTSTSLVPLIDCTAFESRLSMTCHNCTASAVTLAVSMPSPYLSASVSGNGSVCAISCSTWCKLTVSMCGSLTRGMRKGLFTYRDLTMSSTIFFASANNIIVLSWKKSSFSMPAYPEPIPRLTNSTVPDRSTSSIGIP
jgi:hypothetical protein